MIFSLQSLSQLVLLMFTNIPVFNYLFICDILKGCHRLPGSLIISVKHFKGIVLVTLFFFFFFQQDNCNSATRAVLLENVDRSSMPGPWEP